jgi:hypothetical protein
MLGAMRVAALVVIALVAGLSSARAQTQVDVSTGIILMKDDSTPPVNLATRYVKFKSRTKLDPIANQVVPPAPGSDGDPTPAGATGGGATLTVYNSAGSGEVFSIDLPAAKWARYGTGPLYVYSDPTGTILKVYVRPYKLYVRGGGGGWGYTLDEPSQGRIAVRLKLGTGIEWCADAPPHLPAASYDHQDRFQSGKAPPPSPCPALPGS